MVVYEVNITSQTLALACLASYGFASFNRVVSVGTAEKNRARFSNPRTWITLHDIIVDNESKRFV